MSDIKKPLVVIVVVLFLILLGGLYLLSKPKQQTLIPQVTQTPQQPLTEGPKKGEIGYQETQTIREIGSDGVFKGIFEKADNGEIEIRNENKITTYPLTEEISVECTTQNLTSVTELDLKLVTRVKVLTPGNIGGFIPANEPVVIFSQPLNGVVTAHTIAMEAAKCPK